MLPVWGNEQGTENRTLKGLSNVSQTDSFKWRKTEVGAREIAFQKVGWFVAVPRVESYVLIFDFHQKPSIAVNHESSVNQLMRARLSDWRSV